MIAPDMKRKALFKAIADARKEIARLERLFPGSTRVAELRWPAPIGRATKPQGEHG